MTVLIDGHLDLAYNVTSARRDLTLELEALRKRERKRWQEALVTLPELQHGNVGVVFGTLFAMPQEAKRPPGARPPTAWQRQKSYGTPRRPYRPGPGDGGDLRRLCRLERLFGAAHLLAGSEQIHACHRPQLLPVHSPGRVGADDGGLGPHPFAPARDLLRLPTGLHRGHHPLKRERLSLDDWRVQEDLR